MKMNKEKSYVYLKIYFYLLDKISSEEYPIGSLIPTQIELSEKFGVSRLTVRESIKELTSRGLLYSVKGKGTMVIAKPLKTGNEMRGFSNTIENNGESIVNSKVLCIKAMPANKHIASKLKVPPGAPVTYISRIRYVNDEPITVQDSYILRSFVENIDFQTENLSTGSLYALLKEKAGIVFYYVDEEYHAVVCPEEISEILGVAAGTPIIKSLRISYNSANVPIEYNENYGNSLVYRTVLRMRTNESEHIEQDDTFHLLNKIYGSVAGAALGGAMGALTEAKTSESIKTLFNGYVEDLQSIPDDAAAGTLTSSFNLAYDTAIALLQSGGDVTTVLSETTVETFETEPTNRAALKAFPIGLFTYETINQVIHDAISMGMSVCPNNVSLSGAAAIVAAVYTALQQNASIDDVINAGLYGAASGDEIAAQKAVVIPSASIEKRIKLAVSIGRESVNWEETMLELRDIVGTSALAAESIPLVFGIIAANRNDVTAAVKMAVNIGGAASSTASMVGAVMGALYGVKFIPKMLIQKINRVNGIDLEKLAKKIDSIY